MIPTHLDTTCQLRERFQTQVLDTLVFNSEDGKQYLPKTSGEGAICSLFYSLASEDDFQFHFDFSNSQWKASLHIGEDPENRMTARIEAKPLKGQELLQQPLDEVRALLFLMVDDVKEKLTNYFQEFFNGYKND